MGFAAPALCAAASPTPISQQERSWETQIGQQRYASYAARGEIVPPQSPLYSILDPVADAVASVADRDYDAPFRFVLLNEPQPNAFSMPGGNVYVTTAMLSYVRNRDELAGVICHEVNHDIHHDMYNVYEASQGGAQPIAYERAAETNADRAGAYTCAKAGFNPWGMVWNMRQHRWTQRGGQMSADHPTDDQRLSDLTALLTGDRAAFGKFRDDVAASMPLPASAGFGQSAYGTGGPPRYPTGYPPQYPAGYPAPQQAGPYPPPQQAGPYPPPPLPACYPGC
jgi:predicted Zn-dependent protease